jgi:periplasmic divalent cation tolerance protein
VACINYFPIKSIYQWKGKIEKDNEIMVIIKTNNKNKTIDEIKRNHSYELPVITIHNVKTTKDADTWMKEEMK